MEKRLFDFCTSSPHPWLLPSSRRFRNRFLNRPQNRLRNCARKTVNFSLNLEIIFVFN